MADEHVTNLDAFDNDSPNEGLPALEDALCFDEPIAQDDEMPAQVETKPSFEKLLEQVESFAAADVLPAQMYAEGAHQINIDDYVVPEKPDIPVEDKIKGAAQMVAGATLAAAAVPLVVVPIAPTSLMAVGGATLAARGQRTFSGREISAIEEKAEVATEKLTVVTKKTTGGILSKLGEASTRAAQKLSETDWDKKLGLDEDE
ncbi:MAG: hypothetical protein Q4D34_04860 [Eggerthellaceae bacterium]|nr:hypothetical protein [Eggerthellaceae bacterium]